VEQILEEFWIKNQEHFVTESTWEERSTYWEEKFSQALAALGNSQSTSQVPRGTTSSSEIKFSEF
jgi:hypothetical protein